DQIEVGHQHRLREIAAELLVTGHDPVPEFRSGFAERLGIDLIQVSPNLEALINLVRSELPDRNTADQLREALLPEASVDLRNIHNLSEYHGCPNLRTNRSGYPV